MIKLTAPQQRTQPKNSHEIKDFKGGSNKLLDEARVAPNEAVTSLNLLQVQDGLWRPRWGTAYYGSAYSGTIDGAQEYVKADGTTELIVIANGTAYKSQNGSSQTALTGATFTAGNQCYFMQIGGYDSSNVYHSYLYIANGIDPLTRYDGVSLTQYTSIAAPSTLSGTAASTISGTGFTYYGQVTALNAVGETVGSTEATVTVKTKRESWSKSAGDGITWTWASVTGALRYQLYVTDTQGYESLLTSTTNTSIFDDGTTTINTYVQPPLSNGTAAPKFTSMVVSGNRIWATNDANNMYTVYFSGTGKNIGAFSDFFGGGWIGLERGGREIPQKVVHYQSGTGDARATVLCRTPEGRGAVWQINIGSATVGTTSFSVPSASKIVGSSGTEAPLSVVADDNNVLFANRRGVFQLGPQQNFYGILRTNEISVKIRNYWRSLVGSQIKGICAYYYDRKVFISVPTSTAGNSRIIIWDTERQNWSVDWSIGCKQFLEYTDTSGVTHFMYVPVGGTRMVELSENIQGDLGVAFTTDFQTGRLPIAKLWKDFEKIDKVFVKLGSPRGAITFEVSGTQPVTTFKSLTTKTIIPQSSSTGMGWDIMGTVEMGTTAGTPSTFSDSSDPHYVRIRKKLRDIKLRLSTSSVNADYILQGFIFEGTPIRKRPPSSWQLSTLLIGLTTLALLH